MIIYCKNIAVSMLKESKIDYGFKEVLEKKILKCRTNKPIGQSLYQISSPSTAITIERHIVLETAGEAAPPVNERVVLLYRALFEPLYATMEELARGYCCVI